MTIRVAVTGRCGATLELRVPAEGTLMEVLRELDDGVAAICGGLCSCATCHVYVSPATVVRLPPAGDEERELAGALEHFREGESRLSCQISLSPALEVIEVTLAPEE